MKAEELRIGNYLNYTATEHDVLLAKIDWQDLKWLTEDEKGFNLVHKPIQLTTEWLLDFGLEKEHEFYSFGRFTLWSNTENLNDWSLRYNPQHKVPIEAYGDCCLIDAVVTIVESVKYVHQLQNLYFSLTNKELTKT